MKAKFLDHEDANNPLNGCCLTPQEVAQMLRASSGRVPYFCSLETDRGTLLIGVGHEAWCVQLTPPDGMPPYLMAVAGAAEEGEACFEFLSGGTPSPVPRRYCLSWALAEHAISYFLQHGVLPSDVGWVEV